MKNSAKTAQFLFFLELAKVVNFTLIDCAKPLGMENGQIRDDQITASSIYNSYYLPRNGRLNFKATTGRKGAWASGPLDLNQWFQVDFQRSTNITGISTQGRQDLNEHVKTYTISSSDDGKNFHSFKAGAVLKVRYTMNYLSDQKHADYRTARVYKKLNLFNYTDRILQTI